ncbi:MAG TPA: phosphomannomutase/phosphoglucomutase [Pseudoxanthomonas sp.]|nr:phosphomannomutase/phosphoglucomutase [Pseudoxanthomonas sp.]
MSKAIEGDKRAAAANPGRALLWLAVLCLLLSVWFGWNGLRQWRDDQRLEALQRSRDNVVSVVESAHSRQSAQLAQRVAAPDVVAALATGDAAAVSRAIAHGWAGVETVELLPTHLEAAYADPGAFGYSKLALLEAAQQEGVIAARVVRDAGKARFALAKATPQGLIYVRLPLSQLSAGFDAAPLPDGAYLALRQGSYNVGQRGPTSLAEGAEVLAHAIGKTGLRVAAAAPDKEPGPAGLGAINCVVVAVLALILAGLALVAARGGVRVPRLVKRGPEAASHDEPTLGQSLQRDPLPVAPRAPSSSSGAGGRESERLPIEVDPGIFRAYDIRGIVGSNLDASVAEAIGQAIGSVMQSQDLSDIVVGRDGRLSGPELADGLIRGLRRAGRNVIDIGMVPTPVAYFAAYHMHAGSSVAVTGSHNPPDYNGFKVVVGGETLSGEAITDLYERIRDARLHEGAVPGSVQQRDVAADYVQRISDDVQLDRPLKVVVDAGNGVAGDFAPRLLESIGAEVIPLYCDVDGTFPNHHPDPSEPHNLEDLIQTVKRFDADLGLAFDGDGDRLGVVTAQGQIIFPDRLLMLFAADVLERNPGAMVIYDVKCTGKLQGWVLRHGGTPMMWKTGHSLIKAKMRETSAELAGEMSGHFFFQERWFGFDDGMYAAARLLEILALRAETPSEVLNALPDGIATPEIKVPVDTETPHAVVQRFVETARFEGARLSTIDGLRADWEDGWGLVRASNTTPVLVLRFEADDEAALERIKTQFRAHLSLVAPELTPAF